MGDHDAKFMKRAIELSRSALDEPGRLPFGAVVVRDGRIIGEGVNRAPELFDPTSHGEVEAIRDACRREGSVDLSGSDLYTSCEPCSLCVATMHIAGISRLYYAASTTDAAKAYAAILPNLEERATRVREQTGKPTHDRAMPADRMLAGDAAAVLEEWAKARRK